MPLTEPLTAEQKRAAELEAAEQELARKTDDLVAETKEVEAMKSTAEKAQKAAEKAQSAADKAMERVEKAQAGLTEATEKLADREQKLADAEKALEGPKVKKDHIRVRALKTHSCNMGKDRFHFTKGEEYVIPVSAYERFVDSRLPGAIVVALG